ncbi:MAG: alpha/beta fold hydrolase [Verrucomicrobia bacterium]|nr:alpha/beta fold hydrolase [Verrucomicrobiota bacterium]
MFKIHTTLPTRWTTLANGWRLHVRVSPPSVTPRPAVVLVAGLVVTSRNVVPTAERLAAAARGAFSVFALDLPGFGRSTKPAQILTVPALADALLAWMDAEGLARAHFIGNSFGCQVIADLAARHPERVDRLVLTGPALDPAIRNLWKPPLRLLRDAGREPGLIPVVLYDFLEMGPRRAVGTFLHALADRIEEKLPRVQAPVLVLRGEHDPIASQAWCESIVARYLPRCPLAKLETLPGGSHAITYSAPDWVAERASAFFSREGEGVGVRSKEGF